MKWLICHLRKNILLQKFSRKIYRSVNPWDNEYDRYTDLLSMYRVDFKSLLNSDRRVKVGLIAVCNDAFVENFLKSCNQLSIECEVFDPTLNDFFENVLLSKCTHLLSRPNHDRNIDREMFMEKELALRSVSECPLHPSNLEHQIYESKRNLEYFLRCNNIDHAKTFISYSRMDALKYIEKAELPLVFKAKNGAGSSGVEILYTKEQAYRLIKVMFDFKYVNKSFGDYRDSEYGYVFLQEYVENAREYRVIKIGDSWFGHEKAKEANKEFMSGSGLNYWTPPPLELLDYCRQLANEFSFQTMCFDVFIDKSGNYLVNELQSWFGSYNPSQMYLNGVPGRYINKEGCWCFEPGLFNEYGSMCLRLVSIVNNEK